MSPDPTRVAAPEDPAPTGRAGLARPRFKPEVERVDETSIQDLPEPEADAAPRRAERLRAGAPDQAPVSGRRARLRARKVRRIVRHIEPWSVLKISVLFFMSVFLIICVASTVLWNAARSAGAIDDVEGFITSLGFGNCEEIAGQTSTAPTTPVTIDGSAGDGTAATVPEPGSTLPNSDGSCAEGQELVGGFKFEDGRIFQAFAFGGVVLVLAGAAASVVMALLFNLISDLTGGVRVTVLEEEPAPHRRSRTGSPG